jgi:hypothetical protein
MVSLHRAQAKANRATLNAQHMNSTQRYRVGAYDLEALTLPRTVHTRTCVIEQRPSPPTSWWPYPAGVLNIQCQAAKVRAALFKKVRR